ncbi:cytochrome c maturation protein CcmE [Echinimonas agarilytica]|uniref:Cytochrome c-type biogenesis protein CcmE n=1 Tax=Echinimonas agarilytica TaxID=1215918 RepID=A0AA41W4U8_9GAMM|nr:cytochrome c maturation protein CcmE [Echinimonas agarilytica]MCM2679002.1 cytochrome c maturation protein CcmE [Echinimonas agarilytica]
MNPRRQKRLITSIAVICGLGIAVGFILFSMKQNIDLFYTPSEIINGKNETGIKPSVGQRLRIGGMVVAGTVVRDDNSLNVQFDLIDTGPTVTVTFDKILPDLFREGQGIVANGVLVDATTIKADEVLAKHDEEYMPPDVAKAVGKVHPNGVGNKAKEGSY